MKKSIIQELMIFLIPDGKCKDYIYRVRQGQSPYCKDYPAVIGELICKDKLNTTPNHISGKKFYALIEIVEKGKKYGIVVSDDRKVDSTFDDLKSDLIEISRKNSVLAENNMVKLLKKS